MSAAVMGERMKDGMGGGEMGHGHVIAIWHRAVLVSLGSPQSGSRSSWTFSSKWYPNNPNVG
jgi:hypothetical protein